MPFEFENKPVLVYSEPDPKELNPHIFKTATGRPIYEDTEGAFLAREAINNYVTSRIEAGKPAYLNAIVLMASSYEIPGTGLNRSENNTVCAVCRIPGWDAVPAPYGDRNCIPITDNLIYGDSAELVRQSYDLIDFNIVFQHSVYFPREGETIRLEDLLPERYNDPSIFSNPPDQLGARIVRVSFSDYADRSRPEIIGVSSETIPMKFKFDGVFAGTTSSTPTSGGNTANTTAQSLPEFNPNFLTVEKAYQVNYRGDILIRESLALNRLKNVFMPKLEAYLKANYDSGFTVTSFGLKRSLGASISGTGKWRVAGGKHGLGLSMDMKIKNENFKDRGFTEYHLEPRNRAQIKDPKFIKTVNDFVNLPENRDIRWGGLFGPKNDDVQTEEKYYDDTMSYLRGSGRTRKAVASELHHFEIAASHLRGARKGEFLDPYFYTTPYTVSGVTYGPGEGMINVLRQVGFSKPPITNADMLEYTKRVYTIMYEQNREKIDSRKRRV